MFGRKLRDRLKTRLPLAPCGSLSRRRGRRRSPGSDRHRPCENQGFFGLEGLRGESGFPECSCALVLAVGLMSNGLIQAAHKPADAGKLALKCIVLTRSLSENRRSTAEKPFWPIFTLIFVKYE